MAGLGFTVFCAQRIEQVGQAVVIDFLHQRQQAAEFALGETFTSEPVEIGAGLSR